MDSSRSGLLSTIIMTVPLIVVPAIALLRPASTNPGLSTNALQASAEDDFFIEEFGEFGVDDFGNQQSNPQIPISRTGSEDYSDLFTEETQPASSPPIDHISPGRSGKHPPSSHMEDPFALNQSTLANQASNESLNTHSGSAVSPLPESASQLEASLLQQLTTIGAQRTLWFSPGQHGQSGFVAFFPLPQTTTQYRFEAIADTRVEAIRNVLQQVYLWQAQQEAGR